MLQKINLVLLKAWFWILGSIFFLMPGRAGADVKSGLSVIGGNFIGGLSGEASLDINHFIALIISRVLLWVVGPLAVLFLIIGGYWYITSAGNEEQAEKGKKTVVNALIGIVVVVLSYVVVNVIVNLVTTY